MDVAAHDVPNPLKAGEVETLHGGKLQFPQAAVEMRVQYPAGSPANQGDVHCHKIAHECCASAFVNGSSQVLIGFLAKDLQRDDLIPVAVKVVQVLVALQGAEPDELVQCRLGKPLDVHGFLSCKVDEPLEEAAAAVGIVAVERLHHTPFVACPGMDACGLPTAWAGLRRHVLIVPTVKVLPMTCPLGHLHGG